MNKYLIDTQAKSTVVINNCYGGFSVSKICRAKMAELGIIGSDIRFGFERHDTRLIQAIQEIGLESSNGRHSDLQFVTIPTCMLKHYRIDDYDGMESIIFDVAGFKLSQISVINNDASLTADDKYDIINYVINLNILGEEDDF